MCQDKALDLHVLRVILEGPFILGFWPLPHTSFSTTLSGEEGK